MSIAQAADTLAASEESRIDEAVASVVRLLLRALWPMVWAALALILVIPTVCFMLVAFSPAVFDQGTAWLTLRSFTDALRGPTLRGLLDSLAVGTAAALVALVFAAALGWLVHRTTLALRQVWSIGVWALLLTPTYLSVLGWESLIQRQGVLTTVGLDSPPLRAVLFGPVGIVWILAMKGVPFAYLAFSAGLAGLGREFEDAARVHGANRWEALRIALAIVSPAVWSALAIVFAESIGDFGVASTLAATANFPVATFTLYLAIDTMPIRFPVASAVGWFLVLTAGLALAVQARALKGRSYAVLSGRTRPVVPQRLSRVEQAVAVSIVFVFFLLALGVPAIGAISASLLNNFGHFTWASLTLDNYHRAVTDAQLVDPLLLSGRMAAITALGAVVLGVLIARMLARGTIGLAAQLMDWVLVGSVALPSIVLAAGYIFAYNLPVLSDIGINLYGTILLLGAAYLASSLPATSRLLLGPLAQVQRSLLDAARVHGAGEAYAVMTTLVPLLARAMVWAGLLTFGGVLLELPISQMLYPAGQEPLSVAITKQLQNYDFAGGSAEMIVAAAGTLVVVGLVLGAFRLLTPRGWQRPAGARR